MANGAPEHPDWNATLTPPAWNDGTSFVTHDKVTMKCIEGYEFISVSERAKEYTCGTDQTWGAMEDCISEFLYRTSGYKKRTIYLYFV